MPPKKAAPVDPDGLYHLGKEIGELIGAVRQNNHAMNNLSMKVDAFSKVAVIQESMLEQSKLMVEELKTLKREVDDLRSKDDQREGATNILSLIVKSPISAWVAATILGLLAYYFGTKQ